MSTSAELRPQSTSAHWPAVRALTGGGFASVSRWTALAALVCFSVASLSTARAADGTIEQVLPKMVKIFGAGGLKNLEAYGTGFLVSPEGHLVTVWNHVLDADSVTVVLHDGRRFDGKLIGAEPQLDLAVVKIDVEQLPYFNLAQTATAGPGTRVLGFSNMFKVATGSEPVSVLHGVIAARSTLTARRGVHEVPYHGPIYVVDAITNNPGSGGGVLTTRDGRLLGMIGRELRNSKTNTWLNYVVPIDELKDMIDQIITGRFRSREPKRDDDDPTTVGKPRPVRHTPLDLGVVMLPDIVARTPAYIDQVLPNSPAEQAGLKANDLVIFLGDELVQSVRGLRDELARWEGRQVKLVVRRGDELITVELPLPMRESE